MNNSVKEEKQKLKQKRLEKILLDLHHGIAFFDNNGNMYLKKGIVYFNGLTQDTITFDDLITIIENYLDTN